MATSIEEIEQKKGQVEIPPTRRDYFTISEFKRVRKVLPDLELELIFGEIVINKRSRRDYFSTEPREGKFTVCEKFEGDQVLLAPGLDFLQITPAQIFDE